MTVRFGGARSDEHVDCTFLRRAGESQMFHVKRAGSIVRHGTRPVSQRMHKWVGVGAHPPLALVPARIAAGISIRGLRSLLNQRALRRLRSPLNQRGRCPSRRLRGCVHVKAPN